ncbi:unnamed protein product [Arctia plantaginis]|uniref:Uncharacterized protein n=1 Tax=Arctia plantaginis TaxID=874455 RepID=A0A8S0YWI1_ARCPL|nr:unnamed protein product [Arctia plantaginis]
MTMIDGKVCNTATNTSSTSRCFICGATSKDFNDLSKNNVVKCPEALEFGISNYTVKSVKGPLHVGPMSPCKPLKGPGTVP